MRSAVSVSDSPGSSGLKRWGREGSAEKQTRQAEPEGAAAAGVPSPAALTRKLSRPESPKTPKLVFTALHYHLYFDFKIFSFFVKAVP